MAVPASTSPRPSRRRVALFAAAVLAVLLVRPVADHLRAASFLLRLVSPAAGGPLVRPFRHTVEESLAPFASAGAASRARLYLPVGVARPPGMVLLHGVHCRGMDEPRLVLFARALAEAGIAVLTPELRELADYRIDPATLVTIADAAHALRERLGGPGVGLMGLSFAGGLALVAAAGPPAPADIAYVVAVGAHDDLPRVLRFFATDTIERPDGAQQRLHAHDYGPLVLVHASIGDLFPPSDAAVAREALGLWLGEQFEAARSRAGALSPASRARMQTLFDQRVGSLAPELLAVVERQREAMKQVSPHHHLRDVRVPVYLLHGAGDTVIPATETLWLEADAPPGVVRASLVSPAIQHVELQGEPGAGDQWALLHFLAQVLSEARAR